MEEFLGSVEVRTQPHQNIHLLKTFGDLFNVYLLRQVPTLGNCKRTVWKNQFLESEDDIGKGGCLRYE